MREGICWSRRQLEARHQQGLKADLKCVSTGYRAVRWNCSTTFSPRRYALKRRSVAYGLFIGDSRMLPAKEALIKSTEQPRNTRCDPPRGGATPGRCPALSALMNAAATLAVLAVVMAGAGCAGSFSTAMVDTSPTALVERFRSCTSPMGVSSELPIFSGGSIGEESLERYELGAPGLVSDGYHHALLVDRKQSLAYIVQVGGIAGTRTTYGPVRLHSGCGKSAKGMSASGSFDMDRQSSDLK
jgi:hypothetical protein